MIGDRQASTTALMTNNTGSRCQSTPPQTDIVKIQETPVPELPPTQQRPLTPHIPLPTSQNSGSYISPMSVPLFTQDRYSSNSDDELEVDAEITLINRWNKPNQTFTHRSTRGRPTYTPTTTDHTIQGDPNQVASPTHINMLAQARTQNQFLCTKIFLRSRWYSQMHP